MKIKRLCKVCNKEFLLHLCRYHTAQFCSVGCKGIAFRNTIFDVLLDLVICEFVGTEDRHPLCPPTGCWEHPGNGSGSHYSQISIACVNVSGHRLVYSHFVGEIPKGYQIDHLCKNQRCANFEHLEAVSPEENNRRSNSPTALNAKKTHCLQGHPYDERNTQVRPNGGRKCRKCHQEYKKRKRVYEMMQKARDLEAKDRGEA